MSPRLKAVRDLSPPRYPTWELVRMQPSLLTQDVPERWQGRTAVIAALTAATLSTALSGQPVLAGRPIAVVFEHGEGHGSFGCVSIAPPTFLSEEEARQVVNEELARAGLDLASGARTIPSLVRDRHYVYPNSDAARRRRGGYPADEGGARPLALDGYDATRHVGYAFVSQARYKEVGGVDTASFRIQDSRSATWSSVGSYDFAEAARDLARRINDRAQPKRDEAIAVFYEPSIPVGKEIFSTTSATSGEEWKVRFDQAAAAAKDSSRTLLRLQVRDFASWLHEQGILR